jgi:hypothetical protein
MSIGPAFRHLVDDAAIFPPGLAPLPDALARHIVHLTAPYADLVGPFVVDAARLDQALSLAPPCMAMSVVVPAPDAVSSVVVRAAAAGAELASLEVKLDPTLPAGPQVREAAAQVPDGVPAFIEVPRPTSPEWHEVLAVAANTGMRLKFRTGGTEAAAFPSEDEVAGWIVAAVTEGIPFKCTAGLHHAVRHTGAETGFEHHGYLNILVATDAALDGAGLAEVEAVLGEREPGALVAVLRGLPEERLALARTAFVSYGSCSILEPFEDLTHLNLVTLEREDSHR